jgi:tRNA (guanine-N7-)-methyltransferase
MAGEFPKQNFLGLEIREALVKEANRLAREQNLENLHYEFTNASLSLGSLLKHFPREILRDVTIQFPDPWHKRKHAKRRMLTEETVVVLAQYLAEAGKVFVQTDVDFLAEEMLALFRQNESFLEIDSEANPFPIKTEREIAAEAKGLRIYRRIFVKLKR